MDSTVERELTGEPWIALARLLEEGDVAALEAFLASLPPKETARALSRLNDPQVERILAVIGSEHAAEILDLLPDVQAAEIIEELPVAQAAAIVDELPSDEQADVLAEMSEEDAEAILEQMSRPEADQARQLLQYDPHTAGGLMLTEYVAFSDRSTIAQVVDDLRRHGDRYSDYVIQYVYVIDDASLLIGVLRLRDLLLARHGDAPVRSIMIADPLHVMVDTELNELKRLFDDNRFVGMPVTDEVGRLVGVVRRVAVEAALSERETRTFLRFSGLIAAEEFRTMPTFQRSYRRLAWLSINIVLNIIAASVIAFYQDTLAAVIALAVFLPIISDMSGCSGNQAVAVSIRELSLGLVKPYEYIRVLLKEGAVGVMNGIALGLLLGAAAVAWKGNIVLGLVVGGALALNTVLAVTLGGLLPLALRSLRLDPALASGPILTTVTDMCGFLMVLGFASLTLSYLT
ncbi:MAG TPA: magnesium transporter [Gemmatimonadota bacterium]|nr:magnesium transporter [Gemmatimonadota bacterium]